MMEPPGGTALVEESIVESLDFRRAMRKVDEEYGDDWWFKVWGPDKLRGRGPSERHRAESRDWMLNAGEPTGTASAQMAEGFNMLDPIKSTIITPGLDMEGKFAKTGIPASIVTKFLAEHGVVVEKTGLYSFFIMFTIGITKGRWNTLADRAAAVQGRLRRRTRRCGASCPSSWPSSRSTSAWALKRPVPEHPPGMYAKGDIARLTTEMYLSNLQPAMKPTDAYAHIAHRKTERVGIDALEGRITTSLLTPYPPGIPLLIPGERFNKKIVRLPEASRAPSTRASPALPPMCTAWCTRSTRKPARAAITWTA